MCQPGRPLPHGEFHDVSSPSFVAFQSAKSRGSSFFGFGSCSSTSSGFWPGELPVVLEARDAEVDVAVDLVGVLARDQLLDELDDHRDVLRHLRHLVGHAEAERLRVLEVPLGRLLRELGARARGGVVDLVVHVGDVVDERHVVARHLQPLSASTCRSRTAARCRRAHARRPSGRRCTSAPGRAAAAGRPADFV